jgi:hypothetical protein
MRALANLERWGAQLALIFEAAAALERFARLESSRLAATGVVGLLATFGPSGMHNTGAGSRKDISASSLSEPDCTAKHADVADRSDKAMAAQWRKRIPCVLFPEVLLVCNY